MIVSAPQSRWRSVRPILALGLALVCWLTLPSLVGAPLDSSRLAEMDAAVLQAISNHLLPGGVLWVEHGTNEYHKAYGQRALIPEREPMTEDTIFDAASLTKVLATAPSIMLLVQRGQLDLDAPVMRYLPEFGAYGKEKITLRHLLTHTSGLVAGLSRNPDWWGHDKAIALACAERPTNPPGTLFRYSDINYIVLGEVVARVSGRKLNEFTAQEIFEPLQMKDTGYLPPTSKLSRIAPTERVGTEVLRGKVHDPTAQRMGGVAGHAGVFTTAADLARFSRMFLHGGELDGVRLFKPETIAQMTHVQTPSQIDSRRGLGWDIDTGYSRRGTVFPIGSFGHTGFTGVFLWIDPFSNAFCIFLSNRVHPDRSTNIAPLQRTLSTLAAEAITDFDFSHVTGALAPRPTNAPAHF